jgi:hypothetical protein
MMGFTWGDYGALRSGREVATLPPRGVSCPDPSALTERGGMVSGEIPERLAESARHETPPLSVSAFAVTSVSQEAAGVTPQAGALAFMVAPVWRGLL